MSFFVVMRPPGLPLFSNIFTLHLYVLESRLAHDAPAIPVERVSIYYISMIKKGYTTDGLNSSLTHLPRPPLLSWPCMCFLLFSECSDTDNQTNTTHFSTLLQEEEPTRGVTSHTSLPLSQATGVVSELAQL